MIAEATTLWLEDDTQEEVSERLSLYAKRIFNTKIEVPYESQTALAVG